MNKMTPAILRSQISALPETWVWTGAVIAYFAVQTALRLAAGPSLEFDEAEALWFARSLAPGYNAQPPLYFWLQHGVFALFGPSIAALSVLKSTLFAATVLAVLALCRRIAPGIAPAAALSLGLLPEFVWDMQRDRTHTVLLVLMVALTALHLLRSLSAPRRSDALVLGLLVGLGILSKPNYLLFILGLVIAARTVSRRPRNLSLVVSAAVAALIASPWVFWAQLHPDLAGASLGKFGLSTHLGLIGQRLAGAGNFARSLTVLLLLAGLVFAPIAFLGRKSTAQAHPDLRLLIRASLAGLAIAFAATLASGISQVQSRWLLPLVLLVPPAATLLFAQRLSPAFANRLTAAFAGIWIVVLVALPFANASALRHADFAAFDAQLPSGLPVVSPETLILGNLALAGSGRGLYSLTRGGDQPAAGTQVLLVTLRSDLARAAKLGYEIDADSVTPMLLVYGTGQRPYVAARAVKRF